MAGCVGEEGNQDIIQVSLSGGKDMKTCVEGVTYLYMYEGGLRCVFVGKGLKI